MVAVVLLSQNTHEEEERELTVEEVADRLRVSKMTVTRRIAARKLRARREGHSWRILESDLKIYIRQSYPDEPQE